MAGSILGQLLGSVFAGGRGGMGGMGGGLGGMGGMGGGLGGMGGLGAGLGGMGGRGGSPFGNRSALMMMLLPVAMQWVQRNGGLGSVVQRFGQRGYGSHASSWVGTGGNHAIDPQAMSDVMGQEELSRLSQQLGVPQDEVAHGFAEIMPEMVDQLTPDGQVRADADDRLNGGLAQWQNMFASERVD